MSQVHNRLHFTTGCTPLTTVPLDPLDIRWSSRDGIPKKSILWKSVTFDSWLFTVVGFFSDRRFCRLWISFPELRGWGEEVIGYPSTLVLIQFYAFYFFQCSLLRYFIELYSKIEQKPKWNLDENLYLLMELKILEKNICHSKSLKLLSNVCEQQNEI